MTQTSQKPLSPFTLKFCRRMTQTSQKPLPRVQTRLARVHMHQPITIETKGACCVTACSLTNTSHVTGLDLLMKNTTRRMGHVPRGSPRRRWHVRRRSRPRSPRRRWPPQVEMLKRLWQLILSLSPCMILQCLQPPRTVRLRMALCRPQLQCRMRWWITSSQHCGNVD